MGAKPAQIQAIGLPLSPAGPVQLLADTALAGDGDRIGAVVEAIGAKGASA